MQAILTKFLPATNHKGSRIKATAAGGASITIDYSSNLNIEEAHTEAAYALMNKMGWPNQLVSGGTKEGFAFVMLPLVKS